MDKTTIKSKPFIVANVRDILDQYDREEMSFSRMTEMFNEVAFKWADEARRETAVRFEKELAEKDRIIAELKLALNEADKKIKQLDTKPY